MNKQELINEAVHELEGEWRYPDDALYVTKAGHYFYAMANENDSCFLCTKRQFQQRARELGYVNGYRWGVEYQTNGKKPDLPDDVYVEIKHSNEIWIVGNHKVGNCGWSIYSAFKITDIRYKPADTSYLETTAIEPAPEEEGWYDYTNQKALRLPPVGVECEVGFVREWSKTHIVAHHIDGIRAIHCQDGFSTGELGYGSAVAFRPLDWSRKAEAERKRVVDAVWKESNKLHGHHSWDVFAHLYELGFLRMPEDK